MYNNIEDTLNFKDIKGEGKFGGFRVQATPYGFSMSREWLESKIKLRKYDMGGVCKIRIWVYPPTGDEFSEGEQFDQEEGDPDELVIKDENKSILARPLREGQLVLNGGRRMMVLGTEELASGGSPYRLHKKSVWEEKGADPNAASLCNHPHDIDGAYHVGREINICCFVTSRGECR